MTRRTLIAAAAIAGAAGCARDPNYGALDATPPPVDATSVDAGSNNPVPPPAGVVALGVRWLGRVDTTSEPTHPRFSWSGSGFVAGFEGTSLTAALAINGPAMIFKPVVDGTPQPAFTATGGGTTTNVLASGLAAGVHTVELYRQTEGPQGDSRLISLTVGDGALMDPPAGASR